MGMFRNDEDFGQQKNESELLSKMFSLFSVGKAELNWRIVTNNLWVGSPGKKVKDKEKEEKWILESFVCEKKTKKTPPTTIVFTVWVSQWKCAKLKILKIVLWRPGWEREREREREREVENVKTWKMFQFFVFCCNSSLKFFLTFLCLQRKKYFNLKGM